MILCLFLFIFLFLFFFMTFTSSNFFHLFDSFLSSVNKEMSSCADHCAARARRTHAHGQRPSPLHGASAGRKKWRLSAIGHNYDDQRMFEIAEVTIIRVQFYLQRKIANSATAGSHKLFIFSFTTSYSACCR